MGFILLSAITFLSAFLLFQIELIMAKLLLPRYGGSYLVWGACVVFFQGILLAGYLFAHQMIVKKGLVAYQKIHFILLILPFLFFPGRMLHISHDGAALPLVIDIFIKLCVSIGPVFFVLSTISLVTQSWISVSNLKQKANPYALYAVSNLGSFAGLLTYPFFFELNLTNTEQLNVWRLAYVALVLLNAAAYKFVAINKNAGQKEEKALVDWKQAFHWLCLSAGGVVLFLAVTNIATYEIAPVPLLWIIPLSVYLFSFVLNFKDKPFAPPWISRYVFLIIGAATAYYFFSKSFAVTALVSTVVFNFLLFLLCMYAQGQLIRSKPHHSNLTFFYVMISLGGFIGGLLTSWVIPLVSNNLVEFLVGLMLLALGGRKFWLVGVMVLAITFSSPLVSMARKHDSIIKKRNYYGIYDIFESKGVKIMLHGTTLHGIEFTDEKKKWIPLGYYSPTSPLGEVLTKDIFKIHRIGGIGLGTGTIGMYSRGDSPVDFYELDPDVIKMAQDHFSYLSLAPGQVNIFAGDARISLEKQKNVLYDILIVDAFGGDSIPVHLINRDVTALYREHLNEGGAVVFHIPNRYFDLKPILAHIAHDLGGHAAYKVAMDEGWTMHTVWGIITWDQQRYLNLVANYGWRMLNSEDHASVRSWSDEYSSILPIISWEQVTNSFKH